MLPLSLPPLDIKLFLALNTGMQIVEIFDLFLDSRQERLWQTSDIAELPAQV